MLHMFKFKHNSATMWYICFHRFIQKPIRSFRLHMLGRNVGIFVKNASLYVFLPDIEKIAKVYYYWISKKGSQPTMSSFPENVQFLCQNKHRRQHIHVLSAPSPEPLLNTSLAYLPSAAFPLTHSLEQLCEASSRREMMWHPFCNRKHL